MAKIEVLSNDLASQIAAGEVVERPSSALKELLENSVDAGATRCSIEIEGGGITKLSVLDDGCGMTEEDARLSFQRHATSKLRRISDLDSLSSYGFRGEALPSIASVSRFTLRTRTSEQAAGTELVLEGGLNARVQPVGCAVGTLVEVRDLFYNVPARRKFLRSTGTESGHLTETVEALALSRPDLAVTLRRDGRQVRQWHRAADRQERVRKSFEDSLIRCAGQRGPLSVEAFLSTPERARNGAGGLKIMVNDRPIKDRALAVAAAQAYGNALERGRYPRGVIYLDLPPTLVDFNVHPQKLELRFAEPRAVTDALYHVLASQLPKALSIPTPSRNNYGSNNPNSAIAPAQPPAAARTWDIREPSRTTPASRSHPAASVGYTPRVVTPELLVPIAVEPLSSNGSSDASRSGQTNKFSQEIPWRDLRFVGQAQLRFLLCEDSLGLYVIDQHSADERVLLHRMRQQLENQSLTSQPLLFPISLELAESEMKFLKEQGEQVRTLGLDVRMLENNRVNLHSVPQLLQRIAPHQLLGHVLGALQAERARGQSPAESLNQTVGALVCLAALRSGETVSASRGTELLTSLAKVDFSGSCPHGSPLMSFQPWDWTEANE